MKKFHIIIIAVISVLVIFAAWLGLDHEGATTAIGGIGGGIGDALIGVASGINGFLGGFEPWQVATGGILGGIVFTYVLANIFWPRIKQKVKPSTPSTKPYLGAPSYTPPTPVSAPTIANTTPAPIHKPAEETKTE